MPIVHTCKACGCSVSEANILNGSASRRGKSIYCAECSALILEPVEAKAVAAQAEPAPRAPAARAPQVSAAPPSKISARSKLVENLSVEPPAPISNDEIEVVEQYEILTTGAPQELPELDDDEPEEIEGSDEAADEEALPDAPASGGPRRRSRILRKRGPAASASAERKPSQRTVKPAERDRPSRSKIPAAAVKTGKDQKPSRGNMAPAKGSKEVFFKSGSGNRSLAQQVEDVHSDTVDSNILQSVRDMKDKKRRGQGSSEKSIRKAESRTSVRSRRNTVVRSSSNQTQIILGVVGCLALLVVLVFAFSGGSNNTSKRSAPVDEDNLSPSVYIQRAQELQRKGDKLGAADNYAKAAEAFQKQGNTSEAQRYNQAAYGLRFKTAY